MVSKSAILVYNLSNSWAIVGAMIDAINFFNIFLFPYLIDNSESCPAWDILIKHSSTDSEIISLVELNGWIGFGTWLVYSLEYKVCIFTIITAFIIQPLGLYAITVFHDNHRLPKN
jgi:hypothetical protein